MPVNTDMHTEALLARFRALRTETHQTNKPVSEKIKQPTQKVQMDRVEISLSANLTVQAANGIMNDSVVEQINKALQEAGIDLKADDVQAGKIDASPEGTAKRIVDFAAQFLTAYRKNHVDESDDIQINGFMSLTRAAIEKGFQNARDFLNGITKLSDEIEKSIQDTETLTHQYLDDFYKSQISPTGGQTETTVEV